MKKIIFVIIIIAISLFVGYKSYSIINKSELIDNNRIARFVKPDVMGEIESISSGQIILKVIKFNMPNSNKNDAKGEFKIEYTNEKKSISISNDTKIFKNNTKEKGMQMSEIGISNLKVGDILSLTYKQDKSTIDKIVLSEIK